MKRLARLLAFLAAAAMGASAVRWYELRNKNVGSTPEERRRPLPGDEFVHDLVSETTNAITIDAPPEAVWPWLIQMGYDRAGWYSYDLLDRGGVPSADEIVPEFQDIQVGYVLSVDRNATTGFPVIRLDPGESLVFGAPVDTTTREPVKLPGSEQTVTWALHLDPLPDGRTRLLARVRGGDPVRRSRADLPVAMVFDAVHPLMQSKQLRSIKERAERAYREQEQRVAG